MGGKEKNELAPWVDLGKEYMVRSAWMEEMENTSKYLWTYGWEMAQTEGESS